MIFCRIIGSTFFFMRLIVILAALLLVPVFALVLEWRFDARALATKGRCLPSRDTESGQGFAGDVALVVEGAGAALLGGEGGADGVGTTRTARRKPGCGAP